MSHTEQRSDQPEKRRQRHPQGVSAKRRRSGRRDRAGRRADRRREEIRAVRSSAPFPVAVGEVRPLEVENPKEESPGEEREAPKEAPPPAREPKNGGRSGLPFFLLLLPLSASVLLLSIFLLGAAMEAAGEKGEVPAVEPAVQQTPWEWEIESAEDLYLRCAPASVAVLTQGADGREEHRGGFILSEDGFVVTLSVSDSIPQSETKRITVRLSDGRELLASSVGEEALSGIRLLRIPAEGLTPVLLSRSEPRAGQTLFAVGPIEAGAGIGVGEGSSAVRLRQGLLSAPEQRLTLLSGGGVPRRQISLLPTDLIWTASCGGTPIFDGSGILVGIAAPLEGEGGGGYAIPIHRAESILGALRSGAPLTDSLLAPLVSTPPTPQLMGIPSAEDGIDGVRVLGFTGENPVGAGLKEGDLITHVDGTPVDSLAGISSVIASLPVGSEVPVTLRRAGQSLTFLMRLS